MKLSIILFFLPWMLRIQSLMHKKFRERLKEKNLIVQMKVTDDSVGRFYIFQNGKIISKDQLDIEIKRQTPIFLEIINLKRKVKNEPKVTKKKITLSAFVAIQKNVDVEIMYLCQIYTPVIRRLIDESRDKIKELTNWK